MISYIAVMHKSLCVMTPYRDTIYGFIISCINFLNRHSNNTIIDTQVWTSRNAPLSSLALMICFCQCTAIATMRPQRCSSQINNILISFTMWCIVMCVLLVCQYSQVLQQNLGWMAKPAMRHCTSGGIGMLHPSNGSYWFGMEFGNLFFG